MLLRDLQGHGGFSRLVFRALLQYGTDVTGGWTEGAPGERRAHSRMHLTHTCPCVALRQKKGQVQRGGSVMHLHMRPEFLDSSACTYV